jgi:hypothetical protein
LAQFSSNLDSAVLDIKCLVLVKFKTILLGLFSKIREEFKLKFLESIFNLLVANLNESNSLSVDQESDRYAIEMSLNKSIIAQIVDSYLLNSKSSDFFNKNEKYFDYLIGYLNNNNQTKSAQLVRYFKQRFIAKLAADNMKFEFFQQLETKMQFEMLKCTFDMWTCNSSKSLESSLITSESIQENIECLDSIKQALISFKLNSEHFVCLLNERANLEIVSGEVINSTKEMKKQLKKVF